MVFEPVHEQGHRGRCAAHGAQQEIRAARRQHAIGSRYVHLRFHEPSCRADLQEVAEPALHQVLAHAGLVAIHGNAPQGFDETGFQFAFQQGMHVHLGKPFHLFELVGVVENLRQQLHRQAARGVLHVAAAAVGVNAAVAAVLLRVAAWVASAFAVLECLKGRPQQVQQVLGLGQQILQIARAAGHRVVQNEVAAAIIGAGQRVVPGHRPQMRQAPAETLPQAQLQRRHERGDIRLRGQIRNRQQQAQRFRIELTIEI